MLRRHRRRGPGRVVAQLAWAAAVVAMTIAALPTTVVVVVDGAKDGLTGWFPCSPVTFEDSLPETSSSSNGNGSSSERANGSLPVAQCGTFKAPLCYKGICQDDREIDIFVKRITAKIDGKPNVIFMQGGPGAASPAMESGMLSLYRLLDGNVNVYTLDHRGTGRSTKLDCVSAQALMSASPGGSSVSKEEVGSCAAELEKRYGSGNLAGFSITSAASDLNLFITKYLAKSKTYVYGVSYGTTLVERLMHLETPGIAGYILDGVSTTSGAGRSKGMFMSKWDLNMNEVGEYFMSYCEKNEAECGKYFKDKTLAETLKGLIGSMDASLHPCSGFMDKTMSAVFKYPRGDMPPSVPLRQIFGKLLQQATTRVFIPVLTYRINRCDANDQQVIRHFFVTLTKLLNRKPEEDWFMSELLYMLIVYSEFWESPSPSPTEMSTRFISATMAGGMVSQLPTYCAFTKDKTSACMASRRYASYSAGAITYPKDDYWNVAAKPPKDVSVLFLSGKMDPQTPHKYAEYLFDAMKTENKELVAFETATHATLWSAKMSDKPNAESCGMLIFASYVKNGGDLKQVDKSCLTKMPPMTFQVSDRVAARLLNTTSPFDGKYNGQAERDDGTVISGEGDSGSGGGKDKSYKTVFVVFVVLFVVMAAAAVVFVVKWRRAKSSSMVKADVYAQETV